MAIILLGLYVSFYLFSPLMAASLFPFFTPKVMRFERNAGAGALARSRYLGITLSSPVMGSASVGSAK